MKRYIPLLLIITLVVSPLVAESTWEGTTTSSRYGEFPPTGNYGASNSFAPDTVITVKNMDNGKETTITITNRLTNPGLFLLVSNDAAAELGISQGEISRVRASITHQQGAPGALPDDLPYNPDPDVNPAASAAAYLDEEQPVAAEPEDEPVAAEPEDEPVAAEPEDEPVAVEPEDEPVAVEPEDEPVAVEPEDEPVAVEPEDEPVAVEPEDEPVAVEPEDEPVAVEPEDEPVAVEPEDEPVVVEPEDEPVVVEPEDEPVAVEPEDEPVAVELEDEPVAVEPEDEPTPEIGDVDNVDPPIEEEAPDRVADEPTPPLDDDMPAEVSDLERSDGDIGDETDPIVEAPPEPAVEPDSTPTVLGLAPAPVLDDTEKFVLLAEPDVPDVSEMLSEPEADDEGVRISSLGEPAPQLEVRLGPVVPPEPLFEERVVDLEGPVAEDILIVSGLEIPEEGADLAFAVPEVADEPSVVIHETMDDTVAVTALDIAVAEDDATLPEVVDVPLVVEAAEPDDDSGVRVSLLDEPTEPDFADEEPSIATSDEPGVESARVTLVDEADSAPDDDLAGVEVDEPDFVAAEVAPEDAEDILIVSDLVPPPDTATEAVALGDLDEPDPVEAAEVVDEDKDTPIVVNGFSPPHYDGEEIDFVFEPAEPRPPQGRIAGADLLDVAEGDEPGTDVEVASVTEPQIVEETPIVAVVVEPEDAEPVAAEPADPPDADEGRIVDTAIATEAPIENGIDRETVAIPPVDEIEKAAVPEVVEVVEANDVYATELSRESFYLQLGVFAEAGSARNLQDDLAETYPITVYLTESAERPIYKVLVGPLNQDESGALLYQFRTKGYPDAFLRKGTVN
jgi:cell division protein FtsN